jgi:hypothetical protein
MLTAAQAAEKHSRNLINSEQDIRAGIAAVTESPTAAAAKKQEKMLANLTAAVRDGSWAKALNAVPLEEWRRKALDVGVGRIASGITAARADVETFFSEFLPFVQQVQNKVKSMPDLTFQDSINRMVENAKQLREFKRK